MKVLTCAATRRRLDALHDGELRLDEQVAVEAHLEWCDPCRSMREDLQLMQSAIRRKSGRSVLSRDEAAGLQATIVSRMKAEESLSLEAVAREMFQDMHFVYAGLAAVVAVAMCVIVTVGMLRAATMRPAELAALIRGLESPGSNRNPMAMAGRMQMPRALGDPFAMSTGLDNGDAVVALRAVVTREGRVASLELLRDQGTPWIAPGGDEGTLVNEMLGAASETRFEPASVAGLPVAVNVVWILAQTTVRATPGLLTPPAPRRRAA
jgi:Putative zinc-finger